MLLLDRAFSFLYIYSNKTKKDRDNSPNFVCLVCVKTHGKELFLSFHFQKNYLFKNVLFECSNDTAKKPRLMKTQVAREKNLH